MKSLLMGLCAVALISLMSSCRAKTSHQTMSPSEGANLLDGPLTDADLQLAAEDLVQSLVAFAGKKLPKTQMKISLGQVRNRSPENLDVRKLTHRIREELKTSERFEFVSSGLAGEASSEKKKAERVAPQLVDPVEDPLPGETEYLITGEVRGDVRYLGGQQVVDYDVSLELHNLENNKTEWTGRHQIRKRMREPSLR